MKQWIYRFPTFVLMAASAHFTSSGLAQTTWIGTSGSSSGSWGSGPWSNGVPGSSSTAVFSQSPTTEISLSGQDQALAILRFLRDSESYHFSDGRLTFGGSSGQGIQIEYGVTKTQTIDAGIRIANSSTATSLRNDSSAAPLIINGNIYGSATDSASRSLSLTGIGGGTINGNVVDSASPARPLTFSSVSEGGRWTLTGTNTFTGSLPRISTGATLVLDYGTAGSAPMTSGSFQLDQGRIEVVGHATNATSLTLTNLHISGGGNRISTLAGSGGLVVNLGAFTRSSSGVSLLLQGDSEFRTSTANQSTGSAIINSSLIYNKDYAANDGAGKIVAFNNYSSFPSGASGGSGSLVYSGTGNITLNLGATTTFGSRGIKIDTTADGQSMTLIGTGASQQLSVGNGNALLFVGNHDYTINSTYLGNATDGNNNHWINVGTGVLTLNGKLQISTFRKAGLGTIVLNQGTESSVGSITVEDGKLVFQASDISGGAGSDANTISVRNGATLQVQNSLSVRAHSALNLSGLGLAGNGALRNESGTNTIEGNISLGNTTRITSHSGNLILNGSITGGANTALEFDGAGKTTVNGVINAGMTYGVQKLGAGTVELTNNNSYTEGTYVTGGLLLVNNSTAGTSGIGTGAVVVESGGTLGGNGYIRLGDAASVNVRSGGVLAPGASIGTLVLDGGASSGAVLKMELGAQFAFELGAGGSSDTVAFWNYAGSSDLVLNNTAINFTGAQAGDYTLFRFFSDNGVNVVGSSIIDGLVLGSGLEGFNSTLHYNFDSITLTLVAVPEPGSLAMAMGGGLVLLFAARRIKRHTV